MYFPTFNYITDPEIRLDRGRPLPIPCVRAEQHRPLGHGSGSEGVQQGIHGRNEESGDF